jgi:three-Cys-motif partner protein
LAALPQCREFSLAAPHPGVRPYADTNPPQQEKLPLNFPEVVAVDTEPKVKRPSHPVWTENKAKLIEKYLRYFVFVTHHGTYIDGFAGPQERDKPEMWAAKLVLESDPKQIEFLEALKAAQPSRDGKGKKICRDVEIYPGDFNQNVHRLLASGSISQKEATFCLLDQRTFECNWSTVQALANYKQPGNNKIELFYFLAVGWLGRSLAATTQNRQRLKDWWGRDDWEQLRGLRRYKQADIVVRRLKEEFAYKSVKAWDIYERPEKGGNIMYYMVHATDHPEAPKLMSRAYERAVFEEPYEQLKMDFDQLRDE